MKLESEDWREAAVLVLQCEKEGEEHLLFTQRTEAVLHHKGQICFPGGAVDEGDGSLWEAALREAKEEIGVDPSRITRLKELSVQYTPTGFRVTPFVATIEGPQVWSPNPHEIASIFSVPICHLKDLSHFKLLKKEYQGESYIDPHFTFDQYTIWGMSGRILCEYLEIRF